MNGLIEIGDKVVLYGFFNGFTYETDGATNGLVALETGERVEIPLGGIMKKDQIITKKDVISRMKQLFPLSRNEWINENLHEFGDEFGLWKYNAGYEQGKLEGEWVGQQLKDADKIRQELNKPVVKQFVADWYEENKDDFETKLFNTIGLVIRDFEDDDLSVFEEWILDEHKAPLQTLVNMHQFGYTVEKEKRYLVTMKGKIEENVLTYGNNIFRYFFTRENTSEAVRIYHTRKELEEAGFGEVFNSPLFEVEEVE